ncbi:MAG: hypothetical protein ABJH04_19830 [Cyclobacteriaceae bacterium]
MTVPGEAVAVATLPPTQAYAEAALPRCEATVAYAGVTVSGAIDTAATFPCTQAYTDATVSDAGDAVAIPLPTQAYAEATVPDAYGQMASPQEVLMMFEGLWHPSPISMSAFSRNFLTLSLGRG